jgi:hypothetical protein
MIETRDIRERVENLGAIVTIHRNGSITAKWTYFYRGGRSAESCVEKICGEFGREKVTIIDSGDHWHVFVGGAKAGGPKDSYFWVHFAVR